MDQGLIAQIWEFDERGRIKRIFEPIEVNPGLNPEERRPIQEIYTEYQHIFRLEGEKLSCTGVVKYIIPVGSDQSPVNQNQLDYLRYTEKISTGKSVN